MNQREFAERVTAMQGSLYRVAASYLHGSAWIFSADKSG